MPGRFSLTGNFTAFGDDVLKIVIILLEINAPAALLSISARGAAQLNCCFFAVHRLLLRATDR